MRSIKAEGIIIKRKNFGEADRILTVLTKHHGKIRVKAVGIRRIPSRRSAHVELFNHAVLSLYRGRNMPILTEAEVVESFTGVRDDLTAIGDAYHLCELVDGLCPENQENGAVFELLKDALKRLSFYNHSDRRFVLRDAAAGSQLQPISVVAESGMSAFINTFEFELLSTLGYLPPTGESINTRGFIESILERKLKSRDIFERLQ